MTNDKLDLKEAIKKAKRIGLITHKDGDGDAFGATLGLARGLNLLGKTSIIFSNEKLNRVFEFLNENIEYLPKDKYEKVDLVIGLDANSLKRFTIPGIIDCAKSDNVKIAIIDHHLPSDLKGITDYYWQAEDESCTSEMVFDLLTEIGVKIDKITATLILIGIETDTFSMQFVNTRPKTFEVVAELLKLGARLKPIVESAFGGKPISTVKILGRVMNRLELRNGLATSYITKKDATDLKLESEASSGVANFLEQIEGANIVAVFEEREDGIVKVSLRSNNSDADVEKIAKALGGGGHKKASGFEYAGKLEDAMKAVKDIIPQK